MSTIQTQVSYDQARKMYNTAPIKGVGVIVTNAWTGKILLITEHEANPERFKMPGMSSCIMETSQKGEDPYSTLWRAMQEEAPDFHWMFVRQQGYYRVAQNPSQVLLVYVVTAIGNEIALPVYPKTCDIGNPRWVDVEDALQKEWLRGGAFEILQHFAQGLESVCWTECAKPSLSPP